MARDGSGNYTLPQPPFVVGTVIEQGQVNDDLADLANGITNSLSRDAQGGMRADLAMGSHKITGLQTGTADTDGATTLQVNTVATAVTSEATTRAAADTAETNARTSADTTLQTNITAEANTRGTVDGALSTAITNEANTRAAQDGLLNTAITTEVARATAAEATKQASLGFTPVQQGTGIGQFGNAIKLGWSAANKLKATVDTTDLGFMPTTGYPAGFVQGGDSPTLGSVTMASLALSSAGASVSGTGPFMTGSGGTFTPSAWTWNCSCQAVGGYSGSGFMAASDLRAKTEIEDISGDDAVAWVMNAMPRTYLMDGRPSAGFIAQEDVAIGRGAAVISIPDADERYAVSDGVAAAGHRLHRDYNHDVPYLTGALQVAFGRIAELTARLEALEAR